MIRASFPGWLPGSLTPYAMPATEMEGLMNLDFGGRHILITGGTGALGTAVVGLLLDGGATCHVPWVQPRELERFPHKDRVRLVERVELTDERAVEGLYARFDGATRL